MDADDLPDILQPCEHIGEISSVNVHAIGGETLAPTRPVGTGHCGRYLVSEP
jgi:hypothetical protein